MLAALVLVPSAAAWTRLSAGPVQNTVDPAVLRTATGTELVAYDDPQGGTISLVRNGTAPRVLVSGGRVRVGLELLMVP